MKRALIFLVLPMLLGALLAAPVDASPHKHRHVPGHKVKVLPPGHHRFVHRRRTYYHHQGVFYRPRRGAYLVITAPIGAYVDRVPGGYISFGIGPSNYFFVHGTYYLGLGDRYQVVRRPYGADAAIAHATVERSYPSELVIYPRVRQDLATMERDRYECHLWGVHEARFDPSLPNQDLGKRPHYDRAMAACLEGRDYVVK